MSDTTYLLRRWHRLKSDIERHPDDAVRILESAADWAIYRLHCTAPPGGWQPGKSWFLASCLCEEEATALQAYLSAGPRRRHVDLQELPDDHRVIVPSRVGDMLADDALRQKLLDRLTAFTPYDLDALASDYPGGKWVWFVQAQEHWHLWLHEGRLIFPTEWQVGDWGRLGPLESREDVFHVTAGNGLMGVADLSANMLLPCDYAWLSPVSFHHRERRLEAQLPGSPPLESDLIDLTGRRINPPGIKVLAGTFETEGQAVVVREGEGISGHKGLMDIDGALLGDLAWAWICAASNGCAAVQDPDSKLWGYLDWECNLGIPCRFSAIQPFNSDRAPVQIPATPSAPAAYGVIDRDGNWVIEPQWKFIEYLSRHFMVESEDSRFGLYDKHGRCLVEPRPLTAAELEAEGEASYLGAAAAAMAKSLRESPHTGEARNRIAADPEGRLACLAGLFERDAAQGDLANAGLWGMRVEICADHDDGGWAFREGDQGLLWWSYPSSGNMFDLSVEAPVTGLFGRSELSLGVPWGLLRVART